MRFCYFILIASATLLISNNCLIADTSTVIKKLMRNGKRPNDDHRKLTWSIVDGNADFLSNLCRNTVDPNNQHTLDQRNGQHGFCIKDQNKDTDGNTGLGPVIITNPDPNGGGGSGTSGNCDAYSDGDSFTRNGQYCRCSAGRVSCTPAQNPVKQRIRIAAKLKPITTKKKATAHNSCSIRTQAHTRSLLGPMVTLGIVLLFLRRRRSLRS